MLTFHRLYMNLMYIIRMIFSRGILFIFKITLKNIYYLNFFY